MNFPPQSGDRLSEIEIERGIKLIVDAFRFAGFEVSQIVIFEAMSKSG
jgi:hypothetical protein